MPLTTDAVANSSSNPLSPLGRHSLSQLYRCNTSRLSDKNLTRSGWVTAATVVKYELWNLC